MKTGIKGKEFDINRNLLLEPKLSKGTCPNHDLSVKPTLSVLNPRTQEKLPE